MKLLLAFLLATIIFSSFGQTSSDCLKVKTGEFKLSNKISGTTIINRTNKYQIETNDEYGYEAKFEIVWIDDCNYELKNKKLIKGPDELKGDKEDVIRVKILWIKSGIMKVRTTSNFSDIEREVEIEILNKSG